jgi:hypothetical protein
VSRDKTVKTLILVAVLAGAAYLAWRWYQNYKAGQTGGGVPQLGTNLNSVAPELVGGSSGPSVAPVVSTPVTVTITQDTKSAMPETPNTPMIPAGASDSAPLGADTNNPIGAATADSGSDMPEDAATVEPLVKQSQAAMNGTSSRHHHHRRHHGR